MSTRSQQRFGASSLVLLGIAFIVAVALSNQLFRGWKIDLTEDGLFTLSDGTKHMLAGIDEPINLYFYYSDTATEGMPQLRSYAERVREMLEAFVDQADGKLRLQVIDPVPFSEEEDRAAQFGLQAIQPAGAPDPVYLGLAATDSLDNQEIIPFFQPDKEAFLEYDIARLVSKLANPQRTVIGLVSGVDMSGGFNPQSQQMSPPWVVYQQAQQVFEIRNLGTSFSNIADEVGLLWIVQPKGLDDGTLYAIDQFVMRGGKAVIFVDPVADSDPASVQGMPQGMPPMGQGSDLPKLFKAWGIDFPSDQVVADAQLALQITGRDRRPIRHYGYLGITPNFMSDDDIVTADLSVVNLATAGHLSLAEDSPATLEPLLTSSPSSETLPASKFTFLPDPSSLQSGFSAGGEKLTIAGRIGGVLPSAFPDGPPPDAVSSADGDPTDETGDDPAESTHLAESSGPVNLIVVADVDMLSDNLWVQVQSFFGQQIANAFASNGAFVVNALENLSGSSDLIGVRSRASFSRPFTRVDELRANAEARFQATEERLQKELDDTEARLKELQSSREDSNDILLTPEQQAEIDRFIDQRASVRKELRSVQRGLDSDIERLGMILKVINIGLVPLLLTVFVLVAVWRRNRRDT